MGILFILILFFVIGCINGIHIPTAFSRNGIGNALNNSYSIIVGNNIKAINFTIYDRWGN